jgi:hypothetical protein
MWINLTRRCPAQRTHRLAGFYAGEWLKMVDQPPLEQPELRDAQLARIGATSLCQADASTLAFADHSARPNYRTRAVIDNIRFAIGEFSPP